MRERDLGLGLHRWITSEVLLNIRRIGVVQSDKRIHNVLRWFGHVERIKKDRIGLLRGCTWETVQAVVQ